MADSNITCSGLTATSGVGQLALRWSVTNPNAGGLPYLDLATVEVWASATNDRSAALKVGEGIDAFLHAGVPAGETRFYWVRARNVSLLNGEWHPVSPTAGVAGTAGSAQPGPGSITAVELAPDAVTTDAIAPSAVGTTEIADQAIARAKIAFAAVGSAQIENLAVTDAKIQSLSASKISATSLSAISANLGTITAGTITGVTINATTFNGGSFSGGSFTGGSFSGGTFTGTTLNGVEIVGGTFRTSSSFPSVEIASFGAYVAVSSSTGEVARISGGTSGPVLRVNRASSQFAAQFRNTSAAAVEGISPTWAFYASSGAYGPFTAAHELLWPLDEPLPEIGDLIADDGVVLRNGISNTLCRGRLAGSGGPAIGVLASELPWGRTAAMGDDLSDADVETLGQTYRLILVNALGEGQMNVCDAAGPIVAGDLLVASSVPGKAERQPDDLLRSCTVARAREGAAFDAAGRATIAVIYLGG